MGRRVLNIIHPSKSQVGNPVSSKLVYVILTNSVRTSKRTHHHHNKYQFLTLFKELIHVYTDYDTEA
jgi:hypothetical protein